MHAAHIPAAVLRGKFGFERLPDFDASLWNQVKREGKKGITSLSKGFISGSDISSEAVRSSTHNCALIDTGNVIKIKKQDVFKLENIKGKTIVCNPPYGIRTGKNVDLARFYKRFGDFLKQRCSGSTAFIYFGERKYIKSLGLKPSWKKPLSNGGLDGRLAMYELY
jgi:putative N6-adenine-specific DNA methylase